MSKPISEKAQEVINIIEEVRLNPETESLLEEDNCGIKWLPMDNICNDWVKTTEAYKELMIKLNNIICGNLITNEGRNSDVFYELKAAGYSVRTEESDSFGPLTSSIECKEAGWRICYG